MFSWVSLRLVNSGYCKCSSFQLLFTCVTIMYTWKAHAIRDLLYLWENILAGYVISSHSQRCTSCTFKNREGIEVFGSNICYYFQYFYRNSPFHYPFQSWGNLIPYVRGALFLLCVKAFKKDSKSQDSGFVVDWIPAFHTPHVCHRKYLQRPGCQTTTPCPGYAPSYENCTTSKISLRRFT